MTSLLLNTFVYLNLLATPPAEHLFSERIEVRVGSQAIFTYDIESRAELLATQQSRPQQMAREEILAMARDDIINERLIRERLAQAEIRITDQEVERRINSIRVSEGFSTMDEFRRVLQLQGLSMNQLRAQIRQQMEMEQFNSLVQTRVSQTVDEAEARAYYQENQDEFAANYELDIRECLLPTQPNEQQARTLATAYESGNQNFDECVENYSRSPTREVGGFIRNIRRNSLVPAIEQLIFKAEKGEVVMMELPNALRLFEIVEKRNLGPRDFDEVRPLIESRIRSQRMRRASERSLEQLRSETVIRVESPSES